MTIHMPKINTSNNEGGGGGKVKEVALLSITTAPTGEFAKGSKYYNSTDKKIYTAVVADSWDGATVEDPKFGAYYLYNNTTYVWDGDSLEQYNLEDFVPKTDIVNDLTTADATKVLSAEQGQVLKQEVDTKNPILEVDNTINENSYNVVSNKAIAEGLKANTIIIVDDVGDVLPTADTLNKKILLTTNNKIYKTVKEKEINSVFTINGNLLINNKGNILGFSDTNYLTLISQYWIQFFPIKIRVAFEVDTIDVPFLQIYRNDNNSLLLSLSLRNPNNSSCQFTAKVYDNGNIIENQSFYYDKAIYNISGVFEIRMSTGRIDVYKEGTFINSLFLSKLNISTVPYDVAGTVKLSNIVSGGYSKGIYYIDGLNSSIYAGSYIKTEFKLAVNNSGNNFVWQEELTCQQDSKILNKQKNNLCYYNGTQWYIVGENVFTDVENSLPITNIDTQKIYRLHKTKWKYNNIVYDNITQYCTNLPVSSTGIVLDGENETAWTDLTDADITNAGANIWVKTNLDNSWQFGKYDTDSYDYYTLFTKTDVYELYFSPTGVLSDYILISSTEELAFSNFYTKTESDERYLIRQDFLNKFYPKGSIYITYENINPGTFLGGTWELIDSGYYLRSADASETGGEKMGAELPNIKYSKSLSHSGFTGSSSGALSLSHAYSYSWAAESRQGVLEEKFSASKGQTKSDGSSYEAEADSVYKDGGEVRPKSIKVFIWRRTDNGAIIYNPTFTIADTINFESTNDRPAGALAVYQSISLKQDKYIETTITGTTDANGYLTSDIPCNDHYIISCKMANRTGIVLSHVNENNVFTFRCSTWNPNEILGNTSIIVKVIYI